MIPTKIVHSKSVRSGRADKTSRTMFLPHRRATGHHENYEPSDLQRGAVPIRSSAPLPSPAPPHNPIPLSPLRSENPKQPPPSPSQRPCTPCYVARRLSGARLYPLSRPHCSSSSLGRWSRGRRRFRRRRRGSTRCRRGRGSGRLGLPGRRHVWISRPRLGVPETASPSCSPSGYDCGS
jgi:hypothetical protein